MGPTVSVIEYERMAYIKRGMVIVTNAMSNLAHDKSHTKSQEALEDKWNGERYTYE
jgi:hypothetical protein